MDFFSKCSNKEEAKELYRKLVKMFHPDKGGDKDLMIALQAQYDAFKPNYQPTGIFGDAFSRHSYGTRMYPNNNDHYKTLYENAQAVDKRKSKEIDDLYEKNGSLSRRNKDQHDELIQLNKNVADLRKDLEDERSQKIYYMERANTGLWQILKNQILKWSEI
jgi:curved DNA-binding protein CbpA